MPDQEDKPMTFAEKYVPPASVAGDFATELPMLLPQVLTVPGQIVTALSEALPRQEDREAG